jgi:hypothetical protein
MPFPRLRAPRPALDPKTRRRALLGVAFASVTGSVAIALAATRFAVTYPQNSDFAGVAATHQAQSAGLGCIYSRSVQLAGAHLVPGLVPPPLPVDLIWHFNEPPLMTLLAAPFAALRLSTAVDLWEVLLWVALGVCGFLLWRSRNGLQPWLMAAVVAGLVLNEIANTEFSLVQNDALLLVAALVALDMLRRHQDLLSGVLLGLVAVKPQLIFLAVIALLIHHRWRVVAGCAVTVTAIGAISVLMVGASCSLQWLGSATKLGEFQIGIGLPGTVARWAGSTTAAEIAFLALAVAAALVLFRIRRRVETPLFVAIAIALAVVIGLHTLAYDVLFLAPLGVAVARSKPWAVIAAGWAFTVAQAVYPVGTAPILATEVVPFVAVTLAIVFIVRVGAPSQEHPEPINTASHQQLVVAT